DDQIVFASVAGYFRPTSITTRAGYQRTLSYNTATGQISAITDSFGRSLSFTWAGGALSSIAAPGNVSINFTYLYTAAGVADTRLLQTVTVTSGTSSETVTYVYENTAFPRALTGIVDARGVRYGTYTYGNAGQVVGEQHAGGSDNMTFSY